MMMKVVVKELKEGTCEYSGKSGECVVVSLDEDTPDALISTSEFWRLVRFRQRMKEKRTGGDAGRKSSKGAQISD